LGDYLNLSLPLINLSFIHNCQIVFFLIIDALLEEIIGSISKDFGIKLVDEFVKELIVMLDELELGNLDS